MGIAALAGLAGFPAHAQAFDMDTALKPRIIGKPDAPILIAEYFSLSCGHCAAFHAETYPRVKSEWVDTGRARFEFRDFPLGAAAVYAHALARAVPHADYESMLDTLFERQRIWAGGDSPLSEMERIAGDAGIDAAGFAAIIGNRPYLEGVVAIGQKGHDDFGINSTPSFVINEKNVISGNLPYDEFVAAVEKAV